MYLPGFWAKARTMALATLGAVSRRRAYRVSIRWRSIRRFSGGKGEGRAKQASSPPPPR